MNPILIVEDDEDVVNLSTRWLEGAGYSVAHAPDGHAGLDLLDKDPLPTDGFEVLRRLRADPRTKTLPVVMITSFSRDRDVRRARLKRVEHVIKDR
jgi:CheY-like chemotaxis protein